MHKERLKISVCIVTYNHAAYIRDCLSSVIAQQVDADLEVLVGDDCSSDETRLIIQSFSEKYPDVIYPVFHKENLGSTRNYQYLINAASGDYIAQLDGDDFWLPGKLHAQLNFLEKNRQCSSVYTNAIVINNSGNLIAKFNGELPSQFDLNFLVKKGNFLNASSVMYRAQCKHPVLNIQGPVLDFQAHILLASQGDLGYINKVMVSYRKNSTTSMIQSSRQLVLELYWQAILCASLLGVERKILFQGVRHFYRDLVFSALVRGKPKEIGIWREKIMKDCSWISHTSLTFSLVLLLPEVFRQVANLLASYLSKGGIRILHDR
ncbi:MAG: glycosyltransferase [Pseudomonadota bacterium]